MKYFPDRALNQEICVAVSGGRTFVDDHQLITLKIIN